MPLSPSPLLPGTSPLPPLGRRPPGRRALSMGALVAIPLLVALLAGGQFVLPHLLFLAPGMLAQTGNSQSGQLSNSAPFQGFAMTWTRRQTGGGFDTSASLDNMTFEAQTFHMNTVIIPVVADMPIRSGSTIAWHSNDKGNKDTFDDSFYIRAINDAKKAGLVPILELQLRQQDQLSTVRGGIDESSQWIGVAWSNLTSKYNIYGENDPIGVLEHKWFDNYTQFAVHFAQVSEQNHLPYFIIGDQLTNTTIDTNRTTAKSDPGGIDHGVPGESFPNCAGRRDCGWRHVVHALRSPTYATFMGHQAQTGGGYTGKLIYAASWGGAKEGATSSEYDHITWWDAVDYIGVDAYFPLTQNADVSVSDLVSAWHGKGLDLQGNGDIYGKLQTLASTFNRSILFTGAGYVSAAGANGDPLGASSESPDQNEQLNDMQALFQVFSAAPFWQGVFWYTDQPLPVRSSRSDWKTSAYWGGDTLKDCKLAGQWLAQYYTAKPLSP
jgi:Glycoside Hydrolase Family 113